MSPGMKILPAEDSAINQKVAVRMFKRLGHRVNVVANGLDAIKALSCIPYDMVFMDCQMPEMDGFEATRMIRQRENRHPSRPRRWLRCLNDGTGPVHDTATDRGAPVWSRFPGRSPRPSSSAGCTC